MRKSAAEWCVKCGMRNASLACILGVLLHRDHQYVPKGVREVQSISMNVTETLRVRIMQRLSPSG